MIYAYRCAECQLLRCTEDGKVCTECLANMSNTIESEAPATTEEGLSRFLEKSFREYFDQLKQLRNDPNAAQHQPQKSVDVRDVLQVNPKVYDPGFFRYNTNYLHFEDFVRSEVVPRIESRHNVVIKKYNIGPDTFDIDMDLNEFIPYDQAGYIIKSMEQQVVADLNTAFGEWSRNGHKLPW